MDRLDALTAFVRVAEAGSFTRAAQALGVSRPTVTQLVQQLEARLQVRLLHRTTRQVKLTADGAAYYERVVQLLADLDDADAHARGAAGAPAGRLRVDAPAPFARRIIIPALPGFRARYPDIQLVLGVSDREVDVVADGVDCVIRGGEPPASGLRMRRLGELAFGVVASPDYVRRLGHPEHPRALGHGHPLVGFFRQRTGGARTMEMRRGAEVVRVEDDPAIIVDDGDAYLAAALAGLGAVFVPDYMSQAHVARGELVRILEAWEVAPMRMVALSPPNRHPNERVRVFIEWVASLMSELTAERVPRARTRAGGRRTKR